MQTASSFCVGELPDLDVSTLVDLARVSHRVLEFGCGGSTTIWAQFCPPDARIVSVEHVEAWRKHTSDMCRRLGAHLDPKIIPYTGRPLLPTAMTAVSPLPDAWREYLPELPWFDLVFVDSGTWETDDHEGLRIQLAEKAWPLLMPGGQIVFHDTHRPDYIAKVFHFLAPRALEVAAVRSVNAITIATKGVLRRIGNTEAFEGRMPWESGHGPLPAGWPPAR
jgi:predicted O-methyltransferase YrrM